MQDKKFTMIDEKFTCFHCQTKVKPLGYTARDHCPNCLYSLHLDINPGDRKSTCKGILKPVGIEKSKKDRRIRKDESQHNHLLHAVHKRFLQTEKEFRQT